MNNPPLPNGRIVAWDRDQYDADTERERSTRLKAMLDPQGPRSYYRKHIARPFGLSDPMDDYQPKVDHFTLGILFHEMALEGEVNWKACPHRRGSDKWMKAVVKNPGKTIISDANARDLEEWYRALQANAEAMELIGGGGFSEQVILWDELVELPDETVVIPCKAAIDRMGFDGETIVCLKTAAGTTRVDFEKAVEKRRYDFSAAFYCRGRGAVPQFSGTRPTFKHVVVLKGDKDTPPACYVWEMDWQWLMIGDSACVNALRQLAICRRNHELCVQEGRDPSEAWPDKIALTQSDPITPSMYACERHGQMEVVY